MAGSDLYALPDGALDDVASRVGTSLRGEHNGTGLRIGVACALFNGGVTLRLLDGALAALNEAGTGRGDISVAWAPGACASGIQRVQLDTGVPVVFGVLTTDTLEQALERSEPDETNKGREAALTGIEMVRLLRSGPLS